MPEIDGTTGDAEMINSMALNETIEKVEKGLSSIGIKSALFLEMVRLNFLPFLQKIFLHNQKSVQATQGSVQSNIKLYDSDIEIIPSTVLGNDLTAEAAEKIDKKEPIDPPEKSPDNKSQSKAELSVDDLGKKYQKAVEENSEKYKQIEQIKNETVEKYNIKNYLLQGRVCPSYAPFSRNGAGREWIKICDNPEESNYKIESKLLESLLTAQNIQKILKQVLKEGQNVNIVFVGCNNGEKLEKWLKELVQCKCPNKLKLNVIEADETILQHALERVLPITEDSKIEEVKGYNTYFEYLDPHMFGVGPQRALAGEMRGNNGDYQGEKGKTIFILSGNFAGGFNPKTLAKILDTAMAPGDVAVMESHLSNEAIIGHDEDEKDQEKANLVKDYDIPGYRKLVLGILEDFNLKNIDEVGTLNVDVINFMDVDTKDPQTALPAVMFSFIVSDMNKLKLEIDEQEYGPTIGETPHVLPLHLCGKPTTVFLENNMPKLYPNETYTRYGTRFDPDYKGALITVQKRDNAPSYNGNSFTAVESTIPSNNDKIEDTGSQKTTKQETPPAKPEKKGGSNEGESNGNGRTFEY